MNEHEFDRAARAWLDDGPTRMSDRALLSALDEIHATRQRRALWPEWRAMPVSRFVRLAIAAVLVATVGLVAGVGGPSPSLDFPPLTKTFNSPLNGFSISYPANAAITPAVQVWGWPENEVDDGFDVVETGLDAVFKGASNGDAMLGDDSIDTEIDEWLSADRIVPGGCGVPHRQRAEITIDGRSGKIAECPNRLEATVVAGERLYLFTLEHDRKDARAVFDTFLATIDLTPETAAKEPTRTRTFVSPTYGYSIKYGRGQPEPATAPWDPDDQPDADVDSGRRFDGFETGFGAYLEAASTPLPDGVSIDAWVDEFVAPAVARGCGVPRSEQAEIPIDGRPGRIAECPGAPDTDPREVVDTSTASKIFATVAVDGRLYLFILSHYRADGRAYFDAWVATIELRPEDAAAPSRTP